MKLQTLYACMHVCISLKSDIYHPSEKRPLCIEAIKGAEGVNKMTKTLDIAFHDSWCLLKELFLKRINAGVGVDLLLLRLLYLMTALVPCGVNPKNSLDDENGETKANNNTETNNN